MRLIALPVLCTLVVAWAAADDGGAPPVTAHSAEALAQDCRVCHTVPEPTATNAQLLPCPRPEAASSEHDESEAPDVFILGKLSEIYVPVVFPHKLHASMTEMGQGCSVCHHRNPPGRILSCDECHGGPSNPENLRQPGLKGAYHRQCLSCHREWTHETDCVICHARKDPNVEFVPPTSETDIMGMLHPNIEAPDVKVYMAEDLPDTPYTTFHHKEHVELFGLQCVDCHREESCSNCHDSIAKPARVREDPHQDCSRCHQEEVDSDCTYCHSEAPRGPYNHATRTGFDLAAFHAELACRACHEGETRFAALEADCVSCHGTDWAPADFDHAKTGVALDETHLMVDCVGCHTEGIGEPVSCVICHDDGRTTFGSAEDIGG